MLVMEPCNYASNIAYYHATTKICSYAPNWSIPPAEQYSLKRLFAMLSGGSSFLHGSMTNTGETFDTNAISLISAFAHQLTVYSLDTESSVIKQLSYKPRNETLDKIIDRITETIAFEPVTQWRQPVDQGDYQHDYKLTFTAIGVDIVNLLLPKKYTEVLMGYIASIILNETQTQFITQDYIPQLMNLTSTIHITFIQKIKVLSIAFGMLIKIIFAFLYQEKEFPAAITSFMDHPFMIGIGGKVIPIVNGVADALTGFS